MPSNIWDAVSGVIGRPAITSKGKEVQITLTFSEKEWELISLAVGGNESVIPYMTHRAIVLYILLQHERELGREFYIKKEDGTLTEVILIL